LPGSWQKEGEIAVNKLWWDELLKNFKKGLTFFGGAGILKKQKLNSDAGLGHLPSTIEYAPKKQNR
jgi:hypothetical protein